MLKFLGNIIQLIFSPQKGWEDLEYDDLYSDGRRGVLDIRHLYSRCLMPVIVFCPLTYFVRMLYDNGPGFVEALQHVIIQFFCLFLAYHIGNYLFSLFASKIYGQYDTPDQRRFSIMILYCIAVVAIIMMLDNIIKVNLALIKFLPIYVIFIIWKGAEFAGVPSRNIAAYMFVASGAILGAVYGLQFIFSILI